MNKLFVAILLSIGMLACNNLERDMEIANAPFKQAEINLNDVAGTTYTLANMYQGEGLTFGINYQGKIYGWSGMNRFFGTATIKDGHIKIEKLLTTRMGGETQDFIREEVYLKALKSMTNIKLVDGNLIMSNPEGKELVFSEVK